MISPSSRDLSSTTDLVPFSRPFFPELRANVLDFLDHRDAINYSLCCKDFNSESMRIVWYNFDLPSPLYESNRGTFEDACNTLFRVPKRGKFIKSLTLVCSSMNREVRHPSEDAEIERATTILFSLMPNVQSIRFLGFFGGPPMDSARDEGKQRFRVLEGQVLARWLTDEVVIRQIKSIYASPKEILGLASRCSQLTHLSLDFTQQDLAQLDTTTFPTLPSTMLSHLSDLEINIQALHFFAPYLRDVVNLRFHHMLSYPSEKVIATAAEALREAKNLRALQFPNLTTRAVGRLLSGLGPIESLRVVMENDKKSFEESSRGYDWVRVFLHTIEHVPALETYVITTNGTDLSISLQHILDTADALNMYFHNPSSPAFRRLVVRFIATLGGHRENWVCERDDRDVWRSNRSRTTCYSSPHWIE